MSRPYYYVKNLYTGTGSLSSYTFDFRIENLSQLLIIVLNNLNVEVQRVRGDDTSFIDTVTFDTGDTGGGTVNLIADLPLNYRIAILLADDAPVQDYLFRNKTSFTLRRFEDAIDNLAGAIQRLAYRAGKALRLHELDDETSFNLTLPPNISAKGGRLLQINEAGDAFEYGPKVDDLGAGAGGLPDDPIDGGFIEFDTDLQEPIWKEGSYDGISALTGQQFTSTGLKDTLDKIIRITYTPPLISLSASPSQAVREKGTLVSSVDLVANVTLKSNPIGAVRFYRAGVLVNTSGSPVAGANNYTDGTDFTDNMSFYAQVDDTLVDGNGPTTVQSNTVSYPFVYPYYYGADVPGLTAAQVAALTKSVISSNSNLTVNFTAANGDVFYFAYPASYGALTSILDPNGFETLPDWTLTTANITGLDGNAVSYRIYEFNNPVVAGSTSYTFRR